ncbi:sensor histidine kinase [Catenovulum agarivorans]|uniref:sensor histidine kinase n=1 Tax=Catenovulum agarivorans TaxID=1172192 RepID=UPI0013627505|nr:HAMP domain-containing sensor histidine kinase [Catenovulum agarivorans]
MNSQPELSETIELPFAIVAIDKDEANDEYNLTGFSFLTDDSVVTNRLAVKTDEMSDWPLLHSLIENLPKQLEVNSKDWPAGIVEQFWSGALYLNTLVIEQSLVGFILSLQQLEQVLTAEKFKQISQTVSWLLLNRQRHLQLKTQMKAYQQVIDLMPQRVFWKNRKSVYMGSNHAFAKDAGFESPHELVGLTDYDFFPEQAELYRGDDAKTMNERIHLINFEEPQTHKSGETIWLRTSKRPIVSPTDQVVGIVGTYDDISQLKQVQHDLHQANEQLEQRVEERTKALTESNERLLTTLSDLRQAQQHLIESEKMAALGGLVAGIAHEVNTPIGISVTAASHIIELVEDLSKQMQGGTLSKKSFATCMNNLANASSMVLKNLSRASEQISNFKLVAVDQSHDEQRKVELAKYIDHVLDTLTPIVKRHHIQIITAISDDISIQTYPGALAQIVSNLVENAIKHAFPSDNLGIIAICVHALGEQHIEITFSDDGVGMCDDTRKKIFEPFYTTKRGDGGSGLGMHIVYNLVTQKLRGEISCQSIQGCGTQFKLVLPGYLG